MISCSAKILLILLQNYSNPLYAVTVKLYSSTKSNRMSSRNPNFFNIFQRFLVQLTCIYNDPYEFDLIEPNSELHRNIEKFRIWLDKIRFKSIFNEYSRVPLYRNQDQPYDGPTFKKHNLIIFIVRFLTF